MKKILFFFCFLPSLLFSQVFQSAGRGVNGTFDVQFTTTDSMVYDTPGAFMSVHGTIYNLSSTDSVELNILKQFVDLPGTWETALCTDVCYPSSVSSVNLSLAPADSQEFQFYFYTDLVADSGYARILYTNLNVAGNTVQHGYHGVTQNAFGIAEKTEAPLLIYPNPAINMITLQTDLNLSEQSYSFTDQLGRIVLHGKLREGQQAVSIEQLPKGSYLFRLEKSMRGTKVIKQ